MNDNNYDNFYNSVNSDNLNGSVNQTPNNLYDLNQPPAELNNTPTMFEYQNNVGMQQDINNQPDVSFMPTGFDNGIDTNYTSNEFGVSSSVDDSFSTFDRNDYINNYNKPSYDLSNDSSFENSFESQLANSQDISFYDNSGSNNVQPMNYNSGMMQPQMNNNQSGYNPGMMQPQQNFQQSYNPGMMQPQMDYNQPMNNFSANSPADQITTIQRKKEETPSLVRQEGLSKIEYRTTGGTFTKIFLILFYIIVIGSIGYFGYKLYLSKQVFYFNKSKLVMVVDSSFTPKVYVKGEEDSNSNYSWSSTDDSVVTVTDTGYVQAIKKGRAKISVVNKKTGNFEVIMVEVIDVDIKQLEITEDEKKIKEKETYTLVPMINGRSDVIAKYHWSSNDEEVATVDENGVVTGVGEGRTKITLSMDDCELTAEIQIVVTK